MRSRKGGPSRPSRAGGGRGAGAGDARQGSSIWKKVAYGVCVVVLFVAFMTRTGESGDEASPDAVAPKAASSMPRKLIGAGDVHRSQVGDEDHREETDHGELHREDHHDPGGHGIEAEEHPVAHGDEHAHHEAEDVHHEEEEHPAAMHEEEAQTDPPHTQDEHGKEEPHNEQHAGEGAHAEEDMEASHSEQHVEEHTEDTPSEEHMEDHAEKHAAVLRSEEHADEHEEEAHPEEEHADEGEDSEVAAKAAKLEGWQDAAHKADKGDEHEAEEISAGGERLRSPDKKVAAAEGKRLGKWQQAAGAAEQGDEHAEPQEEDHGEAGAPAEGGDDLAQWQAEAGAKEDVARAEAQHGGEHGEEEPNTEEHAKDAHEEAEEHHSEDHAEEEPHSEHVEKPRSDEHAEEEEPHSEEHAEEEPHSEEHAEEEPHSEEHAEEEPHSEHAEEEPHSEEHAEEEPHSEEHAEEEPHSEEHAEEADPHPVAAAQEEHQDNSVAAILERSWRLPAIPRKPGAGLGDLGGTPAAEDATMSSEEVDEGNLYGDWGMGKAIRTVPYENQLGKLIVRSKYGGAMRPRFSPQVMDYALTVPQNIYSLILAVQSKSEESAVQINGRVVAHGGHKMTSPAYALEKNEYTILAVTVVPKHRRATAASAPVYTLKVWRRDDDNDISAENCELAALVAKMQGEKAALRPIFKPSLTKYTIHVPYHRSRVGIIWVRNIPTQFMSTKPSVYLQRTQSTAEMAAKASITDKASGKVVLTLGTVDPKAQVSIDGRPVNMPDLATTGSVPARELLVGENTLTILVTSVAGDVRKYTVKIYRGEDTTADDLEKMVAKRQKELEQFMPDDIRVKSGAAGKVVNKYVQAAFDRCLKAPKPWVPLLGPLPKVKEKKDDLMVMKSEVDELLAEALAAKKKVNDPNEAGAGAGGRDEDLGASGTGGGRYADQMDELVEMLKGKSKEGGGGGGGGHKKDKDKHKDKKKHDGGEDEGGGEETLASEESAEVDDAEDFRRRARALLDLAPEVGGGGAGGAGRRRGGRTLLQGGRRRRGGGGGGSKPFTDFSSLDSEPPEEPTEEMTAAWRAARQGLGQFDENGVARSLTNDERRLSNCLRHMSMCEVPPDRVNDYVTKLPSLKKAWERAKAIKCMSVKEGPCERYTGNRETNTGAFQPSISAASLRDLPKKKVHKTCAVVGSGSPALSSSVNGAAIDRHDAVFRLNVAPTVGYEHYVGNKTNYRVFDLKATQRMAAGRGPGTESSPHVLPPTRDEKWVFWHYGVLQDMQDELNGMDNVPYLSQIRRIYRKPQLVLMSPELISWELDVYFGVMREITRLGLAPRLGGGMGFGYQCPTTMSSGTHAVLLATRLCERVNLFGFTVSPQAVDAKPSRYFGVAEQPLDRREWQTHMWRYEAALAKFLHLAGRASLCTQ